MLVILFLPVSSSVYQDLGYKTLQMTLVDCPGHASLIRTIIGGAQIIDFMMLVIDVTKGSRNYYLEWKGKRSGIVKWESQKRLFLISNHLFSSPFPLHTSPFNAWLFALILSLLLLLSFHIIVRVGIQTQTAECLVIGEICWDRMVAHLSPTLNRLLPLFSITTAWQISLSLSLWYRLLCWTKLICSHPKRVWLRLRRWKQS